MDNTIKQIPYNFERKVLGSMEPTQIDHMVVHKNHSVDVIMKQTPKRVYHYAPGPHVVDGLLLAWAKEQPLDSIFYENMYGREVARTIYR